MEVMSHRSSSALNPNAPLFVPWAYRTVEDFSEEWWELVQSSPWFREYWLQECFQEPEDDLEAFDDHYSFLPEIVSDGDKQEEDEEKKEVVSLASLKWAKARVLPESPKYFEKAPKIVKMKVSPRTIHQPK